MAEARGVSLRPSLGMELRTGHIDRDRYGRSPAPAVSHRPLRGERKSHSATSHASNPERPNTPERVGPLELPRLKALEARAAEVLVSASSAASSASPRSGSSRVHPYNPAGEAVEGSSFELVPSISTQATNMSGRDENVDVTRIQRSDSLSGIQYDPSEPKPGCRNGLRGIDPTSGRAGC